MIPLTSSAVGRLAPSPTGALHLGNARSFLLAWLSIRQQAGTVILRIEDIDSPRVKPWAAAATLDDLRWLGLDWDYGPDCGGPHAPYVQSERLKSYRSTLQVLIERELVYPCDCSRSEIAASASAPHEALEGPVYPGTCRQRSAKDAERFARDEFAWRFRARDQLRTISDAIRGTQSANVAAQLGDFVIAKGDGTPAYQLAVVVDDQAMGVSQVLRGDDLVASTFRQLDLLDVLGWEAPKYAHVPLLIGKDGRRLAKRHGDTRLSWFRQAGFRAEQLVGWLAWSIGLLPKPVSVHPSELVDQFSCHRLARQPTVVELESLLRDLGA